MKVDPLVSLAWCKCFDRRPPHGRADIAALERELEDHRVALTGYAYRMLGSAFEAEDAVQETLVRAWRALDHFEGRAALRSWLFGIATNVCIDMLKARQRRALPMELRPAFARRLLARYCPARAPVGRAGR